MASIVGGTQRIVERIIVFLDAATIMRARLVSPLWKQTIDLAVETSHDLPKKLFLAPAEFEDALNLCGQTSSLCLWGNGVKLLNPYLFSVHATEEQTGLVLRPALAASIMKGEHHQQMWSKMQLSHPPLESYDILPSFSPICFPPQNVRLLRQREDVRSGEFELDLRKPEARTVSEIIDFAEKAVAKWGLKLDWHSTAIVIENEWPMRVTGVEKYLQDDGWEHQEFCERHTEWVDGALDVIECGSLKAKGKTIFNLCCEEARNRGTERMLMGLLDGEAGGQAGVEQQRQGFTRQSFYWLE